MAPRRIYSVDVAVAVDAVQQLNSSVAMLASDRLLYERFAEPGALANGDRVAELVVLLDGLWGTRLFMERGAADRIISNLTSNGGWMAAALEALGPDDLEEHPEKVDQLSQQLLPVILDQVPGQGEGFRQNYSFASKFYHWATRDHFPIMDSRARTRISKMQKDAGARPRIRTSTTAMQGLTYVQEYSRWIRFYSDLIASLPLTDRERLLRADYESQRIGSTPIRNSLLRILDKVFYTQGGGSGQGRTVGPSAGILSVDLDDDLSIEFE